MPQGIILAAGEASRAQTNKMLLKHEGQFLLMHAINGMAASVSKIIVVTGHYDQEIRQALGELQKVTLIHNPDYKQGMFSSILKALPFIEDDFFILPGDCPFVSTDTYVRLLKGFCDIRVPSFNGKNGHPIFLRHKLKQLLMKEPATSNLKQFRNKLGFESLVTNDPQILIDIDTISDFQQLNR